MKSDVRSDVQAVDAGDEAGEALEVVDDDERRAQHRREGAASSSASTWPASTTKGSSRLGGLNERWNRFGRNCARIIFFVFCGAALR